MNLTNSHKNKITESIKTLEAFFDTAKVTDDAYYAFQNLISTFEEMYGVLEQKLNSAEETLECTKAYDETLIDSSIEPTVCFEEAENRKLSYEEVEALKELWNTLSQYWGRVVEADQDLIKWRDNFAKEQEIPIKKSKGLTLELPKK